MSGKNWNLHTVEPPETGTLEGNEQQSSYLGTFQWKGNLVRVRGKNYSYPSSSEVHATVGININRRTKNLASYNDPIH